MEEWYNTWQKVNPSRTPCNILCILELLEDNFYSIKMHFGRSVRRDQTCDFKSFVTPALAVSRWIRETFDPTIYASQKGFA